MTAILFALGILGFLWIIGLAMFALLRVDTSSLRVALTAPALGSAVTVVALFSVSHAGVAMDVGGPPVLGVLIVGSLATLALRRPALPRSSWPVIGICLGGPFLLAWPMLKFGFHWIAYANDDMANYVLSATFLLHHGLLTQVDVVGIHHDRDYASITALLHRDGSRPGADTTLAALASVTGMPVYELFMPLILALGLSTCCAAGALTMQATRRWWAATVAAALAVVSPQATYGLLLQLMPQVWGLGLAAALFALLMRRKMHREPGPPAGDVAAICLLAVAVIVVYVELASTLAVAYLIYVVVLGVRRELAVRIALRVWIPAAVFAVLVLNTYLGPMSAYLKSQAIVGLNGIFAGPPNWGYTLVPSALPGILGLDTLPAVSSSTGLQLSIAAAMIALAGVAILAVVTAFRGVAASVLLVGYIIIGLFLGLKASDFGLFKLYMYVQPFLAAAAAVWLAMIRSPRLRLAAATALIGLVALQLSTQDAYVRESVDPLALRDASSASLLPTFLGYVAEHAGPLVTVTENPVLGKLEAASVGQRPLYFMSQSLFVNLFDTRITSIARRSGWELNSFPLDPPSRQQTDQFWANTAATSALSNKQCTIVLPAGNQIVLNRRSLPEGSRDIVAEPCADVKNKLIFVASKRGWGFFAFRSRSDVAIYPPGPDPFNPGHTMSGFGRYILLGVLGPSKTVRMEVNLETTSLGTPLPPAALVGARRVPLPFVGTGSARVFSAPVKVRMIGGQPYLLLDLGRNGALPISPRTGLANLYGQSVPLDPRYLTAFVRDISLISESQYHSLRRPASVPSFPQGLANPNLEYSGIYEDGWVGQDAYVILAGGGAAEFVLRAEVPPAPGGQSVRVILDGRLLTTRATNPGKLVLRVKVPASRSPRRVELRWRSAPQLSPADHRHAAALLQFLGFVAGERP